MKKPVWLYLFLVAFAGFTLTSTPVLAEDTTPSSDSTSEDSSPSASPGGVSVGSFKMLDSQILEVMALINNPDTNDTSPPVITISEDALFDDPCEPIPVTITDNNEIAFYDVQSVGTTTDDNYNAHVTQDDGATTIEIQLFADSNEALPAPGSTRRFVILATDMAGNSAKATFTLDYSDLASWDCDADGHFHPTEDCDDLDAAINPDATEVCDDQIDNDCDGDIDEGC